VKKFNWTLPRKIILSVVILLAIIIFYPLEYSDDIHAQKFCVYGRVYVEFQHGSRVWGTTLLDNRGQPIGCTDEDSIEKTVNLKETI
jgi:hypothetical protein